MEAVDPRLDELIEEMDDGAPVVRRRRFAWRWVLMGMVGAIVTAVVVTAVVFVVPVVQGWMQGRAKEGEQTAAVQEEGGEEVEKEPAKKGEKKKARWDNLFDLEGQVAPTGPEVIGGEAGISTGEAEAVHAPDPAEVMPLGRAEGKCGFERQEPGIETDGYRIVHGTLGAYGSMYALLQKNGIEPNSILKVTGALEKVCDPKTVRAEDAFELYIDEKTGKFKFLELKRSDTKIFHVLAFDTGEMSAHTVTVPTERRWVKAGGVVEGSLFGSVVEAGLDGSIANEFMGIFGAYAKFSQDTRSGDTFRVIVSGEWLGKEFLGYDPPQILEYNGQKTGQLIAIYYESEPGKGKFYWPDGTSLERLEADVPLDHLRVTSPFDPNRLHPTLHVRKPHLGTDFGAATGTPIYAFDDGVVKRFGMKGAIGNMVHLDHGGGVETIYGHLHGFAKGLHKGKKVKRREVIGYVGNTGRSTGPHLHFGLKKSGKYVDPMKYIKVTTVKEKPIAKSLREGFEKRAKTLLSMLKAIKVPELPEK